MKSFDWAERYQFAQQALLARSLVPNGAVFPVWIDDDHFWYERQGAGGTEIRLLDARSGTVRTSIGYRTLAESLSAYFGATVKPDDLIVANVRFDLAAGAMRFSSYGQAFRYAPAPNILEPTGETANVNWLASPDGRSAIFLRGADLCVRDLVTREERRLTTDGTEYHSYGDVPAAMRGFRQRAGDQAPQALWSPDGSWILTIRTDDRKVPDLPILDYAPTDGIRPRVKANRVSLPGDPHVTAFRIVAIHVATGRQVEARYPDLAAVRMNSSPIGAGLCWWAKDGDRAYFVDIERGEQRAHVVEFDARTGATRIVFTESSDTYVEVGPNVYAPALIAPLPATNELLWYSERDGRGHLYLYDLATGDLRNPVTAGPWQVREILHVDAGRREVLFLAGGIAEAETPYVTKPCIASLDGGAVRILSDLPGDHRLWRQGELNLAIKKLDGLDPIHVSAVSPGGDYFVESVSTVTDPPVTYLRKRDGSEIALLERAAANLPAGWQDPEPVRCKAADGTTDTFGLLFKPLGYDPEGHYPIVDFIYGGPQLSNVPHSHFACGTIDGQRYLDAAHLAAIGAFVLILDGRGTANRERSFRTASHRAAHTASDLEDHIAALTQLAGSRPQIDLGRVGITGFSAGGYMTAHAALRFGDFFKVAVAGGGNYDQALFWHSWGERYHGAFEPDHYAAQAAKTYASGMTGRLLLIHGLMDEGCHPAGLFQLVQALIEAGKDPDLVLLPRGTHDWTGYGARRRWDYLARHLMNGEPVVSLPFEREIDRIVCRAAHNAEPPSAGE